MISEIMRKARSPLCGGLKAVFWVILGICIGYILTLSITNPTHADEFQSFDYSTGNMTWGTIDRSGSTTTIDSYSTRTDSYTTTTITPTPQGYKYNSYDTGTGKLSTGEVESPVLLVPGHIENE